MRKSLLKICVGAAFLSATVFSGAAAPGLVTLHGHVPAAVSGLQPVGSLSATANLQLAIALPLRNQEGLGGLLQQVYDPSSPIYHHYLTPEQFTAQFGPTEQDYRKVMAFARSKGLTVVEDIGIELVGVFEECIGDQRCVKACPEDAIALEKEGERWKVVISSDRCMGTACRRCERACKLKVLHLEKLKIAAG